MITKKSNRPSVSVVVPTFNGRHLLQRHLPHVLGGLQHGDEVVIVDDHSQDETILWLTQEFNLKSSEVKPESINSPKHYYPNLNTLNLAVFYGKTNLVKGVARIVVLSLSKNLRFAGAANLGVLLSSHNLVFLLNNDASPLANTANVLTDHFADSEVFAVGCHEFEAVDEFTPFLQHKINKVVEAVPLVIPEPVLGKVEGSGRNTLQFKNGVFIHNKHSQMVTGETAWAVGGSSMFDRLKWLALGGLDKRFYPAYWEDIDLSFRARKLGWIILFDEDAIAIHQHETTNLKVFGREQIERISWRNAANFLMKNGTPFQKLQYFLFWPYWMWSKIRAK